MFVVVIIARTARETTLTRQVAGGASRRRQARWTPDIEVGSVIVGQG